MLEEIAARSSGMIPPLPVGHHGNSTQYPLGKRAGLNSAVPLPTGTTDEEWDDTLCELPSVKDRFSQLLRAQGLCKKWRHRCQGSPQFLQLQVRRHGNRAAEIYRSLQEGWI